MESEGKLEPAIPVLWLLGKTGAGKSSLVRALTGAGSVGNGFAPGTTRSELHDFPSVTPAVRFLDTRGLDEAGADLGPDIAAARGMAQGVLALVRLDDPVQSALTTILSETRLPVLLVFTGADLVSPADQERARARLRHAVGRDLPFVTLALPAEGVVEGLDALLDALDSFMPRAARVLRKADEARKFQSRRALVLRYAAMAGAGDVVPVAGLAAVPAAQGALLHALAREEGVTLTTARLGVLATALGLGTLVRLAAAHALRQGAKLIPVAGQTLGTAAAAGASFATTYALGRAAHAWLYGLARGAPPDGPTLRALYEQALRGATDAPR